MRGVAATCSASSSSTWASTAASGLTTTTDVQPSVDGPGDPGVDRRPEAGVRARSRPGPSRARRLHRAHGFARARPSEVVDDDDGGRRAHRGAIAGRRGWREATRRSRSSRRRSRARGRRYLVGHRRPVAGGVKREVRAVATSRTASSRVRLYETVRTAHLERARELAPASIVYRRRRYDFDPAVAAGLDLIEAGPVGAAVVLARSDVRELEINEPLMVSSLRAHGPRAGRRDGGGVGPSPPDRRRHLRDRQRRPVPAAASPRRARRRAPPPRRRAHRGSSRAASTASPTGRTRRATCTPGWCPSLRAVGDVHPGPADRVRVRARAGRSAPGPCCSSARSRPARAVLDCSPRGPRSRGSARTPG